MAHLIFDEDEAPQLRESARERAAAGEGLLAYTLEQLAAEGIDPRRMNKPSRPAMEPE
ncbi:hypothetical protein ACFY8C_39400 [Streptomyces flavochromogenes]|uniref:CopG family transcriptional regulator n=1 Tax=Streptomyces flavochromogenes TaxID=68199 RepID=A0ABW6Y458_9ACTN